MTLKAKMCFILFSFIILFISLLNLYFLSKNVSACCGQVKKTEYWCFTYILAWTPVSDSITFTHQADQKKTKSPFISVWSIVLDDYCLIRCVSILASKTLHCSNCKAFFLSHTSLNTQDQNINPTCQYDGDVLRNLLPFFFFFTHWNRRLLKRLIYCLLLSWYDCC